MFVRAEVLPARRVRLRMSATVGSLDCGTSLTPLVSCEAKRAAAVIYATERLLIEASRAKADIPLPA